MADCSLYLITPPDFAPAPFAASLAEALAAARAVGVVPACLQLRLKDRDDADVLAAAACLRPVLSAAGVALIMNDRPDLAARAGADGVHLGQADGSIAAARRLLGPDVDIGATCHDSRHLAMEAAEAGADYVAFGAFYPTQTKVTQVRPDPEILRIWSEMTTLPCVAIGGITPENAPPLIAAGADYIAVSAAVFGHPAGMAAGLIAFADCLRA